MALPFSMVRIAVGKLKTRNRKGFTFYNLNPCNNCGSGGRIRTYDLRVMRTRAVLSSILNNPIFLNNI